ncbi:tryptophan-rich sensory protein [Actinomycetospora sp. NBC_00405]|uniref:tryptophan-rich sensory protein n=1 Tax=Actinomycetospora sp. NBC_00405 TaxID=2975952 RepID=UPI002E224E7C
MRERNRAGLLRAATALALATAQPLSTRAARWTGRGRTEVEQATATEGPVTPAGWAFVIWAPLFAGSLAYAATDLRRERAGEETSGAAGWWANAALAGNVAWSLNAQFRRLDEVSVALILGSASAATTSVALAERDPRAGAGRATARYIGPLAGWLCVAAFANIETTRNLRRGRPEDRQATRSAVALVAAAATVGGAAAAVVRGHRGFALAACWGLTGIAVKALRHGQAPVATAAGVGGVALATSSAVARSVAARR